MLKFSYAAPHSMTFQIRSRRYHVVSSVCLVLCLRKKKWWSANCCHSVLPLLWMSSMIRTQIRNDSVAFFFGDYCFLHSFVSAPHHFNSYEFRRSLDVRRWRWRPYRVQWRSSWSWSRSNAWLRSPIILKSWKLWWITGGVALATTVVLLHRFQPWPRAVFSTTLFFFFFRRSCVKIMHHGPECGVYAMRIAHEST